MVIARTKEELKNLDIVNNYKRKIKFNIGKPIKLNSNNNKRLFEFGFKPIKKYCCENCKSLNLIKLKYSSVCLDCGEIKNEQ